MPKNQRVDILNQLAGRDLSRHVPIFLRIDKTGNLHDYRPFRQVYVVSNHHYQGTGDRYQDHHKDIP